MTFYGELDHKAQITAAVRAHLNTWMAAYLAEMERRTDRDPRVLPRVRGWRTRTEFEQWIDDDPPAGIVVCPGTIGEPEIIRRKYLAWFDVRIGVIVGTGGQPDATEELAAVYGAAVRGAMIQHPSLGDEVHDVRWLGEDYDELPSRRSADTRGVAMNRFAVLRRGFLSLDGGPTTPPDDPYDPPGDVPEITDRRTTVSKREP